MIIYNVTIKADNEIATDYIKWLKEEHIPEVMDTGLFAKHHIYHLLEQDETEGVTYVVQYFCDSINEYNKYILEYAPAMREEGFKRFGNKFAAFRTIMEMV